MNTKQLQSCFEAISCKISDNKNYLISLDQQNGDGDLGISMDDGFHAAVEFLRNNTSEDLGMTLNKVANIFNEAAPSSLGTIIAFVMKGMAKNLKGKTEANCEEMGKAIIAGLDNVSGKAGSKEGEKTILDSMYPGARALSENAGDGNTKAIDMAAAAALVGSENTKNMKAVWGRAAYFGEKSIGILDGGSVVGRLIFEAINDWNKKRGSKNEKNNEQG